jgi:hypothetical protein
MRRTILGAAVLLAWAAPVGAQTAGFTPPAEEVNCKEWTRRLELGVEVIAPTPVNRVNEAAAALQKARAEMQAGRWFACSVAADSGLRALNAG